MHADLLHLLSETFKSRNLEPICLLEQDIARGETALGKPVKFDQVWAQVQTILKEKPQGEKRKDILRLLALTAMMDGFKEEMIEDLVNPAQLWPEETDALLNFMKMAPKKAKSGVLSSLFSHGDRKSQPKPEAMSYDLARYVPSLKHILQELVEGKLSEKDYPKLPHMVTSPSPGARSKATWAKKGDEPASPKVRHLHILPSFAHSLAPTRSLERVFGTLCSSLGG